MADITKSTINRTQINSFIPEKVAFEAINVLTSYMNLAKTVNRDFEDEVASEGDSVRVPKYGAISANEMSQTGVVTPQNPADDEVSIVLDQHWESTFLIRDVARAMSRPKVLRGYVKGGMIALAEKIETSLAALYASAGDTVAGGATPDKTHLRGARKILVDNKVPRIAPKYAYLSTEYYDNLLSDTVIGNAASFGSREALLSGKIPQLYGFGIFETQNVQTSGSPSTYHCLAYTEDAMALVMRPLASLPGDVGQKLGVETATVVDLESGVGMRVSYSWDKDHLGVQVTLDILFGVGILNADLLVDIQHT